MGEPSVGRASRVRYAVLAATVVVYLITYMDRGVIAAATPSIQKEFGFSLITMGWILGLFQWGYALFQIPGGWLGDRFGPRRTLSGIVIWWSAFTAATALMWSAPAMGICRFLFGMGEAGAFPNATRSLSRWILPSERGFAQGLTHAGARLGGALTPLIVVPLIALLGWRGPFFLFAVLGLVWAVLWFVFYRDTPAEHPSVNEGERKLIQDALGSAPGRSKVSPPWGVILRSPQMWILAAMYACYAFDFGVILAWFPKYLTAERGFSMKEMALGASLPLFFGVIGGIAGGVISDRLIKKTGNIKMARRIVAVTGFTLAAVMIPLSVMSPDPIIGVLLFCVAVFGFELTVGISWAVTLDIGGEFAGTVSAMMNTGGNLAGAFGTTLTGYLVTVYGWNAMFFVLAGLAALGGLLYLRIDASRSLFAPHRQDA